MVRLSVMSAPRTPSAAKVCSGGVLSLYVACGACSLITSFNGLTGSPAGAGDAEAAKGREDAGDAQGTSDAAGVGSPPSDGGCTGVKVICGTACVDPTSDPDHCGGCDTVCNSALCGVTLAADMSTLPANWTFNGAAVYDPVVESARLTTANANNVAGTVVYGHAIVTDSFTASFQFRIGANGSAGAFDGMGFMIEANGPTALGSIGGGLGMEGLDGFGVELDIYNNGQCGDSNSDHVGIDMLSDCAGLPTSIFASSALTSATTPINLDDAQWHAAVVQLSAGAMSVTIELEPVATNIALTGFAGGTAYYYGFGGAIGNNTGAQTEIKNVTVTFPTPRCL
jgi:Bacterial lectin